VLDHLNYYDNYSLGGVGAVALDKAGNLAAATSSGGKPNKTPGAIGDAAIIGASCYANNNTCAVSGSGKSGPFIRHSVAAAISQGIELGPLSLEDSVNRVIERILEPEDGGVIAVDSQGNVVMRMNTLSMLRGVVNGEGLVKVEVW